MTFFLRINSTSSGAEMNLKVGEGGTDPERKWEGTDPAQSAGKKNYFGHAPPLFFGSKSTISRFGKRFHDGQYSLVSFVFFYSRCPHAQPFVKVGGGTSPHAPWSRRHCPYHTFTYQLLI